MEVLVKSKHSSLCGEYASLKEALDLMKISYPDMEYGEDGYGDNFRWLCWTSLDALLDRGESPFATIVYL